MADILSGGGDPSGAIAEVGSRLISKIFGGLLWFGLAIIVFGVLGYLMWYFLIYKKKFDIEVKITSERAEDKSSIYFDKAALLIDKSSGGRYLRLWKTKAELPAPKFNIFQTVGTKDYLELYRTADNIFYYLTPTKIDRRYVIRSDGKIYPMAGQVNRMIDPEMDFWATKRKKSNKGMFAPDSILTKILLYLPFILSLAISIFIIYVLMSNLPAVLSELGSLVREMKSMQGGVAIPA